MLIDRWTPVTSDFGLIEAPADVVAAAYIEWQSGIGARPARSSRSSFEAALHALPPLSAEKRRAAYVPTVAGWSAFFQSGIDGSDPFPAMSYLAQRMDVRAMRICSTPADEKYPATIWEVYASSSRGGDENLGYVRSIAAANDGGRWVFEQFGTPFSFERLDAYAAPRKRDRFPRQLLEEYLLAFGLTPFQDSFYCASDDAPAIIVERLQRWDQPPREYTLDEARRREPWKRAPAS